MLRHTRIAICFLAGSLLLLSLSGRLATAQNQPGISNPPTEEVARRDAILEDVRKFDREGKRPEAIAAAERMLALEQDIFGNESRELTGTLDFLWREELRSGHVEKALTRSLESYARYQKLDGNVILDDEEEDEEIGEDL